ncbi:RNA polymerase sigma-70 factor [Sphingobacterium yanglingense]|uniref:RNA polymerase sigma-70 factor (ECF subfamily) n=1 Tax=Sphingobacterium yanglingense TaxID=1437280 RepID=A0A4R6WP14_9SPHI|nr:RNA polymerase sigma-70 factor [Sphingobacterium yanglingense]TDQ82825.1 RNA polymerase sigma-70 factor (ECF subfamily) [Sphingobacterium yanglingense]
MENIAFRLKNKDKEAFKVFFYEYKDAVYKYACLHIKEPDLAEDIVQETFTRFWNKVTDIDISQNIKSYLFTIARNLVFDELRKRLLFESYSSYYQKTKEGYSNSNEDQLYFNELEKLYQEAISLLPEKRRQIFQLSKLENLSNEEIAEMLDISINTVRDQLVKSNKFVKSFILERSDLLALAAIFIKII